MTHKRTDPITFYRANELRRNMTPVESKLWARLRSHRLNGLSFRHQHALGPFIVDFCCPTHRNTIEIDGDSHASQIEYDHSRTQWLDEHGWQELRFTNREVEINIETVLEVILQALTPSQPPPSPKSG